MKANTWRSAMIEESDDLWPLLILPFVARACSFTEPANARRGPRGNTSLQRATFLDFIFCFCCCLRFEDCFHINAPYVTHTHTTEAPLSRADTFQATSTLPPMPDPLPCWKMDSVTEVTSSNKALMGGKWSVSLAKMCTIWNSRTSHQTLWRWRKKSAH